jgi:hypothetical protein
MTRALTKPPETSWLLGYTGTARNIGQAAENQNLKGGWACTVGEVSNGGGDQWRSTKCRKEQDEIVFSTHCGSDKKEDSSDIIFRDTVAGVAVDSIEVSCLYADGPGL